jgi:hypothetical protein
MRRARRRALPWSKIPTNIFDRGGLESDQRRGAKVYAPGELRSGGSKSVAISPEPVWVEWQIPGAATGSCLFVRLLGIR